MDDGVVAALVNVGFSQYEARTYAGMIGREPLTGYAVAKATQVPQPKIYETLGRLVERGAVLQVSDRPAKYLAVAPEVVLREFESAFRHRMATVELEISRMQRQSADSQTRRAYHDSKSWLRISDVAKDVVTSARDRVYVSGHTQHLEPLAPSIEAADRRGVRVHLLSFGELAVSLGDQSASIRHSSTDRILYRHHQARHLAVTSDAGRALWALAPNGDDWQAVWCDDDELFTALVMGFVRHDIFTQRIYHDFSGDMSERYGPGLEGLFAWHADGGAEPLEERSPGRAGTQLTGRGRERTQRSPGRTG
jgi:sugar-specific transcriptional regulator TrmB